MAGVTEMVDRDGKGDIDDRSERWLERQRWLG